MSTALALILGFAALFGFGAEGPRSEAYYRSEFVQGALTRSSVTVSEGFLGIEWPCEMQKVGSDSEMCYAGLSYGPGGVELNTGP